MEFEKYIETLNLQPHPEGGWYKEVYRSIEKYPYGDGNFPSERNYCTAIYFLITTGKFSAFHRIKSDETWHFYAGDALEVIEIDAGGNLKKTVIGNNISIGNKLQYTVPAGIWFGSRVSSGGVFSLVGCTVSPGFDFRDFEMAERQKLLQDFPQHKNIINDLTRI